MTTILAVATGLGALVSWWQARKATKAAAQVDAGKQAVAAVDADLAAVDAELKTK